MRAAPRIKAEHIALLFVFVGCVLACFLPLGRDQAGFAYLTQIAFKGGLPYVANWDQKGPLIQLLYLPTVLGTPAQYKPHLLDLFAVLACCLLIARLGKKLRPDFPAAIAIILYGAVYFSLGYWNIAQTESFINIFTLAAALMLIGATAPRLLLCGILLGTAGLIKPITVFHLVGAILVVFLSNRKEPAQSLRKSALLITGFALPPLVTAIIYLADGHLINLLECYLFYNVAAGPISGGGAHLAGQIFKAIFVLLTNFGLFIIFCLIGYFHLKKNERSIPRTIIAIFLLASVVGVTAQMKFWLYQWVLVLPFAVVYGTLGVSSLYARLKGGPALSQRYLAFVGLAALLLFYSLLVYKGLAIYPLLKADNRQHYLEQFSNKWEATDTLQSYRAAEYIREHTDPDDRVQFWGFEMLAGYLADRKSSSRFLFDLPLTSELGGYARTMQLKWRKEFIADIKSKPPELLVMLHNDINAFEPQDSLTQAALLPEFLAFIDRRYDRENTIGRMIFYRYRGANDQPE
jgi:hypothetical protein